MLFVELPVRDLAAARAFHEASASASRTSSTERVVEMRLRAVIQRG
jgi:predicted lactoylglutathione lyase